jgi:probable aminopeptidase NPEPL1
MLSPAGFMGSGPILRNSPGVGFGESTGIRYKQAFKGDPMTDIRFRQKVSAALRRADAAVVIAPMAALEEGWHREALGTDWAGALDRLVEDAKPGNLGCVLSTYGADGVPRRLHIAVLPDRFARHNTPSRSESIRHCLAQVKPGEAKRLAVVIRLSEPDHYLAAAVAVARCFPLFSRASGNGGRERKLEVNVAAALPDASEARPTAEISDTVEAVRLASRLVDTPTEDMKTADLEKEARAAAKGIAGVKVSSIVGDRLLTAKLGGIHAVGRTATVPPRLVLMEYRPAKKKPKRTVALVGKGVVYDTGGLSIKVGGIMSNMKGDMGGAAAVLGAFLVLAKAKVPYRIHALLCLAENAVGPNSYRPDDILDMHSGKTVEINNTDAEGRLLLADGVSYAARKLRAGVVIDAATLTGAALITTGRIVSCFATNRDDLEEIAVESGRRTGDLTHPLLFLPEFLKSEFESKVADMRNSVKDRMNAQSSAAGQFVYNHIEDLDVPWLHLDIAGPAFRDGRGTGHGVALIADIVRHL